MNRTIAVPPTVKASEGRMFQFGRTSIYVGPREPSPNARNLKRPPVLAYSRIGEDTEPHVVAEFPNAASAEQFMAAMMLGVEEMAQAAQGLAQAMRESPPEGDITINPVDDGDDPASGGAVTMNTLRGIDASLAAKIEAGGGSIQIVTEPGVDPAVARRIAHQLRGERA